jgi:hypothetical protein
VLNVDGYGDAVPVPAFGPRMVCSRVSSWLKIRSKWRYTYFMSPVAAEHMVSSSTLRVRRHRERRREGLCLFTVEVPEATIEEARARRLLRPEDNRKSWPVVQACYAAQLSDAALERLIISPR